MNTEQLQFNRTPICSAPATSAITKIEIALNNLIGQFAESINAAVELAPSLSELDSSPVPEIEARGERIAQVVKTIKSLIPDLPNNRWPPNYFENELKALKQECAKTEEELKTTVNACSKLSDALHDEICSIANSVAQNSIETKLLP